MWGLERRPGFQYPPVGLQCFHSTLICPSPAFPLSFTPGPFPLPIFGDRILFVTEANLECTIYPKLASNSKQSSCLSLSRAGIAGEKMLPWPLLSFQMKSCYKADQVGCKLAILQSQLLEITTHHYKRSIKLPFDGLLRPSGTFREIIWYKLRPNRGVCVGSLSLAVP